MNDKRKCPFWVGKDKYCKLEMLTIARCTKEDGLRCFLVAVHAVEVGMSVKNLIEWCGDK